MFDNTKAKLSQKGSAITVEAVALRKGAGKKWLDVPTYMSADMESLRAAGAQCDSDGTHMSAEVFVINTIDTPESARILEASDVYYTVRDGRKSP